MNLKKMYEIKMMHPLTHNNIEANQLENKVVMFEVATLSLNGKLTHHPIT